MRFRSELTVTTVIKPDGSYIWQTCMCPRQIQGKRACFYSAVAPVNQLDAEKRVGRAGRLADRLLNQDAIVLDELGYLPFSADVGALLFHLIGKLYARVSLIVTTESPLSDFHIRSEFERPQSFCRQRVRLRPVKYQTENSDTAEPAMYPKPAVYSGQLWRPVSPLTWSELHAGSQLLPAAHACLPDITAVKFYDGRHGRLASKSHVVLISYPGLADT